MTDALKERIKIAYIEAIGKHARANWQTSLGTDQSDITKNFLSEIEKIMDEEYKTWSEAVLAAIECFPEKQDRCRSEDCLPYEFCGCAVDEHNDVIDACIVTLAQKLMGSGSAGIVLEQELRKK